MIFILIESSVDVSIQTESNTVVTAHSNDDDDDVDLSYTGQLYYSRHGDGVTTNQWLARFIAIKDITALKSVC